MELIFAVVKVVLGDCKTPEIFVHRNRLARQRTISLHTERLLRTLCNRILIECFLLDRAILQMALAALVVADLAHLGNTTNILVYVVNSLLGLSSIECHALEVSL